LVKSVTTIAIFALVLNTILPAWSAEKPKELLVHRVRKAIDRGIQYLRDQEHGTGNWEGVDKTSVAWRGGWTSLAMLALLNSGVKHDDPIIERGLTYLRQIESSQTYVVALQTMVFAEVGRNEDRQRIQNHVNWLIEAMIVESGQCKGWTYTRAKSQISDNSNTQYALLGLHAGHLAGAKISRNDWLLIQDFYIRTQQPDHGWSYNPALGRFATGTTLTMTTAGLCGLLISGMELNAGREVLRGDGTASNCGLYTENKPVVNALGWISDHFRIDLPSGTFYSLYGIERAGRLSGQRFFGEHDWYREGCQYLVDTQKEEGEAGYWQKNTIHDSWPIVSTSFALLFLSKGRTPVLWTKFAWGEST